MSRFLPRHGSFNAQLRSQVDTRTKGKINKPLQDFKGTTGASTAQGQFKTTPVKLLPPPQLSYVTGVRTAPLPGFFHRCTQSSARTRLLNPQAGFIL